MSASFSERLGGFATVKNVYGKPIGAQRKTIIPVARVRYGFGGGGRARNGSEEVGTPEEGGGGGGLVAVPSGVIEVAASGTRFVSASDTRKMLTVAALGLVAGLILARRK